jgi:hypothetical protein
MAIPSTGSISMSTIQTEFGGSSPISLSEYYRSNTYEAAVSGNNTTVPQSGTIKMSQFRGTFQARYIVWKLLGAGGGGGYGVFNGAGSGKAADGGNSTITYNGTTYTANGGAGGDNGAIYYNQSGSAGQNADTSQGYSENFGTSGGESAQQTNGAAGTGFAAGGSGAGGDNPDQYDSSGNKGEGGLAGSEQTQTDYVAVGGSIVYDLGVGGAGGDSSFDGAAGLSGLVVINSNGSEVVRTGTDGTYTVV